MPEIDKAGSFYLGRPHDLATTKNATEPMLYDSKDLTTHAVCVGMTGSGKTGLCLALLEEAALNGIPAIAIDPKGDLGNLLLAFPNLAPSDFRPWIDESEAARKKMSPDEFAASQAELWREGLEQWDEGPDRIRRFCDSVDRVIYTPGSSAGIPITVLKSFSAPPKELVADADAFSERVSSATSGLLALMGVEADPVRSREHIFLSTLLDTAWRAGKDVDLRQLAQDIRSPSISQIGDSTLEEFYPAKERNKLAMSVNNLLASPSFASWLEGESLDIQKILYTADGKPRLAIMSIAHLDDAQRMFFVTILLNEILAWVRTQSGTSSLRALLYMDEVFGYFPPLGNPPAKRPMLTLLKQARAYGLGVVLATQNPVDLDYKGLSNAGTWFLGRLQTERDKSRVMEGLEGASAQAGASFDRQKMEAALAALGKRVFLMNNVHDNAPVVFQSRWALSYLCGPLTRTQIKTLMDPVRSKYSSPKTDGAETSKGSHHAPAANASSSSQATPFSPTGNRPLLPAEVVERFLPIAQLVPDGYRLEYRPGLLGKAKMHFVSKADGVDTWRTCSLLQTIRETPPDDIWEGAVDTKLPDDPDERPDSQGQFAELPSQLALKRNYAIFLKQLKEHLYRKGLLKLQRCEALNETSKAGENEEEFRARLVPKLPEKLAERKEELGKSYEKKLQDAKLKVDKAQSRVKTRFRQWMAKLLSVGWVILDTVLAAFKINLPGRRRSVDVALRSITTESGNQETAKIDLEHAQQNLHGLQQEHDDQLKQLETSLSVAGLVIEPMELKPQKGDITADEVTLVWLPFRISPAGAAEPVYEAGDAH
jgi:hypothetical protein